MTPKQEHEAKEALRGAMKAIEGLQRDNEMLAIKARAFDTFASLISAISPQRGAMAYGPDPVWILRQLLADIDATEKEEAAKAAQVEKEQQEGGYGAS